MQALGTNFVEAMAPLGWPGPKDEDWKYLNLSQLASIPFVVADKETHPVSLDEVSSYILKESNPILLIFINGQLDQKLSQLGSLPKGLSIENKTLPPEKQNPFTALNGTFTKKGICIHLSKNQELEKPLQLLFYSYSNGVASMSHPRVRIVLEDNAKATLFETYAGGAGQPYLTNAVREILLKEGASLQYVNLQQEHEKAFHLSHLTVSQEKESCFSSHCISFGGMLSRHQISNKMKGKGAHCTLNGFYWADRHQQVDHHTQIDHLTPHTTSKELYKGILKDQAHGVFNGKIIVHPKAIKTDAQLKNHNLLLSNQAEINPKPELQIYADDVKCSHGATVGQVDEEALFYLRSRGIPEASARKLLVLAFANDLLETIKNEPIRKQVQHFLNTKMEEESFDATRS